MLNLPSVLRLLPGTARKRDSVDPRGPADFHREMIEIRQRFVTLRNPEEAGLGNCPA